MSPEVDSPDQDAGVRRQLTLQLPIALWRRLIALKPEDQGPGRWIQEAVEARCNAEEARK